MTVKKVGKHPFDLQSYLMGQPRISAGDFQIISRVDNRSWQNSTIPNCALTAPLVPGREVAEIYVHHPWGRHRAGYRAQHGSSWGHWCWWVVGTCRGAQSSTLRNDSRPAKSFMPVLMGVPVTHQRCCAGSRLVSIDVMVFCRDVRRSSATAKG